MTDTQDREQKDHDQKVHEQKDSDRKDHDQKDSQKKDHEQKDSEKKDHDHKHNDESLTFRDTFSMWHNIFSIYIYITSVILKIVHQLVRIDAACS